MDYQFTCDPAKNKRNIKERGIDLLKAGEILYEPHLDTEDDREDYGEERNIAKGYLNGIPLVVVYTIRGIDHRHIISARKLQKHEEAEMVQELNLEAKQQNQKKTRWKK